MSATKIMANRDKYTGAEQRAYDRGWFDGDEDAKSENAGAGVFHGFIVGFTVAAILAVGLYLAG